MDFGSRDPILVVRMDGPGVRVGRIPLADLVLFGKHLQMAVDRVARVLTGEERSVRRGKKPKSVEASCTLEVVAFQPGSFQLALDLPRDQLQFQEIDLGVQALEHLIGGLVEVAGNAPALPVGYDAGVLISWREAGRLLSRGLSRIEFTLNTSPTPKVACYDSAVHRRVLQHILEPVKNKRSFEGRLLMADFKETARRCRLNTAAGESITCSFDDDQLDLVLEGLLHHVRITGEAETDRTTGRMAVHIEDLEVLEAEPIYDAPSMRTRESGFWEGESIEALADKQGVQPVGRLEQLYCDFWPQGEDLDDVLDEIYEQRRLDRDRGTF
ncbi:MAG: hypothetical protein ACM3ZA_14995 [Bacillota bacterium]